MEYGLAVLSDGESSSLFFTVRFVGYHSFKDVAYQD